MANDIESIAKRMREQSNRSTQYPLFVVQHRVQRWNEDGDERERKSSDDGLDTDGLCGNCLKDYERDGEMKEHCSRCLDSTWHFFNWEWEFAMMAGVFFTEEACELHIKTNHYHYDKPRSYVIGSWRNPEMVAVMQHILGDDVPNYYE